MKRHVRYEGYLYTGDDEAKNSGRQYLSRRVWKDHCRIEYLHRRIWEDNKGPIKQGFFVHHKDGNKYNNALDNLELMEQKVHSSYHSRLYNKQCTTEQQKARAAKAKANTHINRSCKHCGKEYVNHSAWGTYCSQSCWDAARMKKCVCCGKMFVAHHKTMSCCSLACRYEYYHVQKRIESVCSVCGKLFMESYARAKMPKQRRYCSDECRRVGKNEVNKMCARKRRARKKDAGS